MSLNSGPRTWAALGARFVLGLALVLLAAVPNAHAHDAVLDQLVLRPDPPSGALAGELILDPELTRTRETEPTSAHGARLLELSSQNITIEVDGAPVAVRYSLRELWRGGGATAGDLVTLEGSLPREASTLRVFAGAAFENLVVSVQMPSARSRAETHSWLLGAGDWTPPYRLGAALADSEWRLGGADTFAEEAQRRATPLGLAQRFVRLGFEHILPSGFDHLAFVAALVLGAARRYRQILVSLSLFTLAHTLTLAIGSRGWIEFPAAAVEILIAISICALALANLRPKPGPARAGPLHHAVVFGFGLIHGLGFGRGLAELGFGGEHWLIALLSFNLGVELGQLVWVAFLLVVLRVVNEPRRIQRYVIFPGSVLIALLGAFYVIERASSAISNPSHLPESSEPESTLAR